MKNPALKVYCPTCYRAVGKACVGGVNHPARVAQLCKVITKLPVQACSHAELRYRVDVLEVELFK